MKDALLLLGEAPPAPTSPVCKASSQLSLALTCSPVSPPPLRPKSPMKAALEAAVDDARREVAAAAVHVVEAIEDEVLQKKLRCVTCCFLSLLFACYCFLTTRQKKEGGIRPGGYSFYSSPC